jgi:hypothetical protein
MLHCARQNWIRASIYFCLACCFRSNGALLAGYIIWGMLLEPLKRPVSNPNGFLIYEHLTGR